MEVLIALLAGGGAVAAGRYLWDRSRRRHQESEELAGVRTLADEDVTLLGEELQRLDAEVGGLDADGRADYRRALDAYESAQRLVPRLSRAEEVSKVTDTLSSGRYAMACVRARLAGEPVPELRVPCFFNPQHGPSVRDVQFTPRGRGTRLVPACAQDAARVESGQAPQVRTVRVGARTVPYWEAGDAYLPYGEGYFVTGALQGAYAMSWAFTVPEVAPPADLGGHAGGGHAGHDASFGGGFDGGIDGGGGGGGGD
jgi:hypothetical protein